MLKTAEKQCLPGSKAPHQEDHMLKLQNITVTVEGENNSSRNILDNVSLRVPQNCFFVITGPNGSGKSTLAKVIMGMQTPTSGKIFLKDKDITHSSVTERAQMGIGFAFQQPVRFKGISVHDLLSLASGRNLSVEEACSCLSAVGMCAKDYVNRELNATLSGGEMKRIEIAMLIARGPRLSIFDEPEAGIDLWSFQNLITVFRHIKETQKGSALIISHQERILEVADTVAVLSNGAISDIGPAKKILPSLVLRAPSCEHIRSLA